MSGGELPMRVRFEAARDGRFADHPTLVLLHGTGGDENDLVPLGRQLSRDANLLSPRGNVLENGMPRFFRRLAEGVFDEQDLRLRTAELAETISLAVKQEGLDPARLVAVGFSNGANIAASLLLLRPEVLAGAVLFRAMTPLTPESLPDLRGRRILMCEGEFDPIVPRENAERLAGMFREAGADVTMRWREAAHGLTREDVDDSAAWLSDLAV